MIFIFYHNEHAMKKLIWISLSAILTICFLTQSLFAYDTTNKNQWKVVESAKVDTSIPDWFKPMETENLNDWLNILPDNLKKYRKEDQFMVIPAMGLITPIVELETTNPDFKLATKGGNFDYNKYLISWPTIYPGTAPVGSPGNTFIFAHSNYWIDKPGDFKTIFRLTYNIQQWDSILYYKKENKKWTQYTYEVTKSILVNETDIWVMLPEKGKKELTLSACRPIGTAKQRWINRASLVDEKVIDYEVNQDTSTQLPNNPLIITWTLSWKDSIWSITVEYNPNSRTEEVSKAVKSALEAASIIINSK